MFLFNYLDWVPEGTWFERRLAFGDYLIITVSLVVTYVTTIKEVSFDRMAAQAGKERL